MAPRDIRTRLTRRASKAGVTLSAGLTDALTTYYELLVRWNQKINLTSLSDPDHAIDRLLLEPMAAVRHLSAGSAFIDIGSGGGSPAIPLAFGFGQGVQLTMVEVKSRKSAFLREAVRVLGLTGRAQVETARYEELLARPELLEGFDLLTLRAVRVEVRILTTIQAFVRPGGTLGLFRGLSGPEHPEVIPPLEWAATVPLLDSLQSRLTVLKKADRIPGVSRGTLPHR